METSSYPMGITNKESVFQLLPGVSRTFALTIPQLPDPLKLIVTNAYLLCRIADTIEDDSELTHAEKANFHQRFRAVLSGEESESVFANELYPLLSQVNILPAELQLIKQIPVVIKCYRSFTPRQQASLKRCINIMSTGMPEFQRTASLSGLDNLSSMNRYCYYVAGVVGEMLTELFCDYSLSINKNKTKLMDLAVSFGQGLQMTNILKDFWEDRQRSVCWLPADVFASHGLNLSTWSPGQHQKEFNQSIHALVNIAKKHLQDAMSYTFLIPKQETGIRRFTLWAIGMAVLTLSNIYRHPDFKNSSEVKISRQMVKAIILVSNTSCYSNRLLNYLFTWFTRKLA